MMLLFSLRISYNRPYKPHNNPAYNLIANLDYKYFFKIKNPIIT